VKGKIDCPPVFTPNSPSFFHCPNNHILLPLSSATVEAFFKLAKLPVEFNFAHLSQIIAKLSKTGLLKAL
jgi:hypothetical protein